MLEWINLHSLAVLFAGLVVGGMALFTFVVAPGVFRHLDRVAAGALMGELFPQYYLAMAMAAAGTAGLLAVRQTHGLEVALMAVVAFGFVAARRGLLPRMEEARAAATGSERAHGVFRRLHGISMILNLAQLLLATFVLLRLAA